MTAEISLEGLAFYAYHGFYEEERKSGNRFLVDIKVNTSIPENSDFENLDNTVNYEELYKIVESEMIKPSLLLENVAKNILDQAFIKISKAESVQVSISKLSPPVGGPCQKSKVTLKRTK